MLVMFPGNCCVFFEMVRFRTDFGENVSESQEFQIKLFQAIIFAREAMEFTNVEFGPSNSREQFEMSKWASIGFYGPLERSLKTVCDNIRIDAGALRKQLSDCYVALFG